jgi:hypothetical protein
MIYFLFHDTMVLESAQKAEKKGRGRPRKYPVEQTGTTRKDLQAAVVRGEKHVSTSAHSVVASDAQIHKHSKTVHHAAHAPVVSKKSPSSSADVMTREEELAAFERHSNKSGVLTLFVLLLGVALIGYGMYNKLKQSDMSPSAPISPSTSQSAPSKAKGALSALSAAVLWKGESENTTTPESIDTTPSANEGNTTKNLPSDWADVLAQYIKAIGDKNIAALSPLQDSSFKALPTLRTYFNATRLTTFAGAVKNLAIKDLTENTKDPVLGRNPTAKAYDFSFTYTLADGKEYADAWRAYTVVKGSGTVINGFVYQGKNTSASPFFSFSKFGIK